MRDVPDPTLSMTLLCNRSDLDRDYPLHVDLPDGTGIALYLVDDEVLATQDLCSHGEALLSEGFVEGAEVVCPFHMGRFDIRTGRATGAPCHLPIRTIPLRIDGEQVSLDLERYKAEAMDER
jgi:p-cumate 2,3-dioxygenase ferredoxin subunit